MRVVCAYLAGDAREVCAAVTVAHVTHVRHVDLAANEQLAGEETKGKEGEMEADRNLVAHWMEGDTVRSRRRSESATQ
jgi:hypothetical protein